MEIRKIIRQIIIENFSNSDVNDKFLTPKEKESKRMDEKYKIHEFIRDIFDIYREDGKKFRVVNKEEFYNTLYNDKLDKRTVSTIYTNNNGQFISPLGRRRFHSPADEIESWVTKNGWILGQVWHKGDEYKGDKMVAYFINDSIR